MMPIVIRGGGTTNTISRWLCSLSVGGFLLLAVANGLRWGGGTPVLLPIALAVLFGAMLLYTET
jgi:hypothetical protein